VWDTTSAPNGAYSVKVVASDQRSNPPDSSLRGELESTAFDIDNTPPTLTIAPLRRDGNQIVVPVEVRDADSTIREVQYSLETDRWQSAFPADGMLDARLEKIEVRLPVAAAGRTLVIRATDAMSNLGSANVALR
jgi:hypothetical protein